MNDNNNEGNTVMVDRDISATKTMPDQVLPMALTNLDNLPVIKTAPVEVGKYIQRPLEVMLDVPITVVFEVGRAEITIKELMELKQGSMIDIGKVAVDSIDIRINDSIIAYGETIALQQRYGVRFADLEMLCELDDLDAQFQEV